MDIQTMNCKPKQASTQNASKCFKDQKGVQTEWRDSTKKCVCPLSLPLSNENIVWLAQKELNTIQRRDNATIVQTDSREITQPMHVFHQCEIAFDLSFDLLI
jgi:hypothetical protein